MNNILLLGATGSIGQNVVDLALNHPDKFSIHTMVAKTNTKILAELALRVGAKRVVIEDLEQFTSLKQLLAGHEIEVLAGYDAVIEVAKDSYDTTVSAIVGASGLAPTFASIKNSKKVAIANKESMVCAGEFIKQRAREFSTELVPIDSEHTSLLQILEKDNELKNLTITASGGAFRDLSKIEIESAPAASALKHPNWAMGNKITIDSATLANKGLEVIEALQFLDVPLSKVKVMIHRESIIHALTTYEDGSTLAHMGLPDMRTSIAYALTMPNRIATKVPELDLIKIGSLTFAEPDYERFPMLKIALDIATEAPSVRTVYNVLNEIAVYKYLKGEIGFYGINDLVEKGLARSISPCNSIDDILLLIDLLRAENA